MYKTCLNCNKEITSKYGKKFCSLNCSACYNNSKRLPLTEETKKKIKDAVRKFLIKRGENPQKNKIDLTKRVSCFCKVCNKEILAYKKLPRTYCSLKCKSVFGGRKSAEKRNSRGKNEIYFYELCLKYFKDVKHNLPIFNGWDADIIIHDIKYAILWNGIHHYKQIYKTQSLKQVQVRDEIKIREILKANYTPYVIRDLGQYDEKFVNEKFNEFIKLKGLEQLPNPLPKLIGLNS